MDELTPLQAEMIGTMERNNSLITSLYLRLHESLTLGDVLPGIVSSVIWQTRYEIARTWIEKYAQYEWKELNAPTTLTPEVRKLTELQILGTMIEIAKYVEKVLTEPRSGVAGFRRRILLMVNDVSERTMEDQHRAFSLYHDVPYSIWCSFFRLLSNSQALRDYYQGNTVVLDYADSVLTISNTVRKDSGLSRIEAPPGARIEIQESDYVTIDENNRIHVDFSQGIKQSLHIDSVVLSHASTLLPNKEGEERAKAILYEKNSILLWKKRFGSSGKSRPEEENYGELAWQK